MKKYVFTALLMFSISSQAQTTELSFMTFLGSTRCLNDQSSGVDCQFATSEYALTKLPLTLNPSTGNSEGKWKIEIENSEFIGTAGFYMTLYANGKIKLSVVMVNLNTENAQVLSHLAGGAYFQQGQPMNELFFFGDAMDSVDGKARFNTSFYVAGVQNSTPFQKTPWLELLKGSVMKNTAALR